MLSILQGFFYKLLANLLLNPDMGAGDISTLLQTTKALSHSKFFCTLTA